MRDLALDLPPVLRSAMGRQRSFILFGGTILGLGIGIAMATHALLAGVVLRPLPYRNDAELLWVWSVRPDVDHAFYSIPDLEDFRARSRTLASIAGVYPYGATITSGDRAERIYGMKVTGNLFATLGVRAAHGRLLDDADAAAPESSVVLGWRLFQRLLDGDAARVGESLIVDGKACTVIGVLGPDFVFPGADPDVQFALPLSLSTHPLRERRGGNFIRPVVRRLPGVDTAAVRAELTAIGADLAREYPDTNSMKLAPSVVPMREEMAGRSGPVLELIAAATLVVLAIVALNLGALLLVRIRRREPELAVQRALGSSTARLARHYLAEVGLVALVALALALLSAEPLRRLMLMAMSVDVPRLDSATLGGDSLAIGLLACVTVLVVAAAPGLWWLRRAGMDVHSLRGARATASGGRFANAVVVAQVAFAVTLLFGVATATSTYRRLADLDLGFRADHVVTARIALPGDAYPDLPAVFGYLERAERALRGMPGVTGVALSNALPLSAVNSRADFVIPGRAANAGDFVPSAQIRWVSPDYFAMLRMRLIAGRGIETTDNSDSEPIAIIDEALARQYWPGADPMDQVLTVEAQAPSRVVGVVSDVPHFELGEVPRGTVYLPVSQLSGRYRGFFSSRIYLAARTAEDPTKALATFETVLRKVDAGVPPTNIQPLSDYTVQALASIRAAMTLMLALVLAATGLTALGLFALTTGNSVARRREIGIRLALGSSRAAVERVLVGHAARCTALGLVLGSFIGAATLPVISAALGPVASIATGALLALAAGFVAIAALVAWIPAHWHTVLEPAEVLRAD